ncbi:hypothetical protein QOT17_015408 [Balamuthia mandrillaris]
MEERKACGLTWRDVPAEIWAEIFSYCPFESLLRCCLVSREFLVLASDDLLWKNVYISQFGDPPAEEEEGEEDGLTWLERFKRETTTPKWDEVRSEQKDRWLFANNNKMITRNGSNGCYPKAIMTPNLFQLDRFIAKLHFTMRISSELGLFTQPDLPEVLRRQSSFSDSYSGPSCSYLSLHNSRIYHYVGGSQKENKQVVPGMTYSDYTKDYTVDVLIEETGSTSSSSGHEEEGRRITFWLNGHKLGTVPLPQRPYELMFTSGNFNAMIRLDRVVFYAKSPLSNEGEEEGEGAGQGKEKPQAAGRAKSIAKLAQKIKNTFS